jgi:hypothetical protein
MCYYETYFTGRETEAQGSSISAQVAQLVSDPACIVLVLPLRAKYCKSQHGNSWQSHITDPE